MAQGTRSFSARWAADVLDRLRRRGELAGTSMSRLAERYVDEGTRMDEFPGIAFREGPTGRRAALAGGPDIWEVVMTIKGGEGSGEDAVASVAELLDLPEPQVRTALRYYASFPEEVDDRIARNVVHADEAEAAWRREQAALA